MEPRQSLINDLNILQSVFVHSPAASTIIDTHASIKLANPEFEKITGYDHDQLEGIRKLTELIPAGDRDAVKSLLGRLKAGGVVHPDKIECGIVDKNGELKTTFLTGEAINDSDLILVSLIDITEQKRNETNLKSAKARAEESDRLKTAFLGNLSHEIRTPMNAIVGFTSLLQTDKLSEGKRAMYLTQIINGSTELLQLIEKSLTLSRIDLDQIKINKRQFFINKRLDELHEKYLSILATSGKENIELIIEKDKQEDDFVVQLDHMRILEVLNNLLENAVKFTERGQITLGYTCLEVASEDSCDTLQFYVKDTGIGIPEESTGIIFDRFVKLVDKNETAFRGAGLGLAIAHDLVKRMGGKIWVETDVGTGSKFYFTVPVIQSKIQQYSPSESLAHKEYDDWSCYEILIAEDMESNYLYIKELLAPSKMKILRARDGLEAVEIFESHPQIDLVLMDILMPGLDGYEATYHIRHIRNEVPVIAHTAFSFEGEVQDGLYAGCFTGYIMKPFTRDMLIANLKKYLPVK